MKSVIFTFILLFFFSSIYADILYYTTFPIGRKVIGVPITGGSILNIVVPTYNGTTTPSIVAIATQRNNHKLWMIDQGTVNFQSVVSYDLSTNTFAIGGNFPSSWNVFPNSQCQGFYVSNIPDAYGEYLCFNFFIYFSLVLLRVCIVNVCTMSFWRLDNFAGFYLLRFLLF
jgi:hypothetical protein